MLGQLLAPEIGEYLERRDFAGLREALSRLEAPEIADLVDELPQDHRALVFRILPRAVATETFEYLEAEAKKSLVDTLAHEQVTTLLNDMSPDDRTAFLEELPAEVTRQLLSHLSTEERKVASWLLGYPEESIGRLMTPDYVAVHGDWTVARVLEHIRKYGRDSETLNVIYVVDDRGILVDDLRIRELLLANPETRTVDLADRHFVALKATDDQEAAIELFREYDRVALPVTDSVGVLIGIVTVDDVLDVAEEEATEDMHKMGGSEALDDPYLETPFWALIQKRARWLVVLFFGEMLTTSVMAYYETELVRAVVLALFIPLIISSGGNSGSQAATFVIRAMALGEVSAQDWRRVMWRELRSGLALGSILALIGVIRVVLWEEAFGTYGENWLLLAVTVGLALLGVVMWGTFTGSMLPFVLRRLGADPAASSAPFVATLVDVIGIVIYFTVASLFLAEALH
jgi:magnesium transporter